MAERLEAAPCSRNGVRAKGETRKPAQCSTQPEQYMHPQMQSVVSDRPGIAASASCCSKPLVLCLPTYPR